MKVLKTKWRWLVLPLILCTVLLIGVYSLLHWLLIIQWGIGINDNIVQAYLPIILAFILAYKQVRPGLRILKLGITRTGADIYYVVAALTIAAPMVCTQLYLSTATRSLLVVKNIEQVKPAAKTKYYRLEEYYIDKQRTGEYLNTTYGTFGGHDRYELFLAMPIYVRAADTGSGTASCFLAVKYSMLANVKKSTNKLLEQQELFENSYRALRAMDMSRIAYFERLGHNGEVAENRKAVQNSPVKSTAHPVVLLPGYGPFESRNGNLLQWIFKSFAIGFGLWLLMIAMPEINYNELLRKKSRV